MVLDNEGMDVVDEFEEVGRGEEIGCILQGFKNLSKSILSHAQRDNTNYEEDVAINKDIELYEMKIGCMLKNAINKAKAKANDMKERLKK